MPITVHNRLPVADRHPGPACFDLIKAFEGWASNAYQDEGGIWTMGWGFTEGVKAGDRIDISTADIRLVEEVGKAAARVRAKVKVDLTQTEFDALVSYEYNVRGGLKPSLLACLNGGVTDTREVMKPGSYEAAVKQIVRAHWGDRTWSSKSFPDGVARKIKTPIRGLYRRRLAEACVFKGLTEWRGPCSENIIKLPVEVYQKGDQWYARAVDGEATEEDWVFERATEEMRFKPPASEVTKPWPAPKPAPTVTIITDKPAAPATGPAAGTPGLSPQPEVPASPAPQKPAPSSVSGPSDAAGATVARVPVQPSPPIVVAGQDGVKPKSPNTLPADAVPYKIDPNAGLKPLEESDRAKGYVIQQVGIGAIRLGSLGVFGSTIQGGAQVVQGDPVLSNIILMAFCAGGIALVGYVIKTYGEWKKKRGEQKASQGLF